MYVKKNLAQHKNWLYFISEKVLRLCYQKECKPSGTALRSTLEEKKKIWHKSGNSTFCFSGNKKKRFPSDRTYKLIQTPVAVSWMVRREKDKREHKQDML